jgi:hypothetical protein
MTSGRVVAAAVISTITIAIYGILIWQVVEKRNVEARLNPDRISVPCLVTDSTAVFEKCGLNGTKFTMALDVYIPSQETTAVPSMLPTPCGPTDVQRTLGFSGHPVGWIDCYIDPLTSGVFLYPSKHRDRNDIDIELTVYLGTVAVIAVLFLCDYLILTPRAPAVSDVCVKLLSNTVKTKMADFGTRLRAFELQCGSNPQYAENLIDRVWRGITEETDSIYAKTKLYHTCDGTTLYATIINCDGTYPIDDVRCVSDQVYDDEKLSIV